MSKMSNLDILIRERLERGEEPVDIAYALEIPVSWVYEICNTQEEPAKEVDQ
jgi:hypothetical protein